MNILQKVCRAIILCFGIACLSNNHSVAVNAELGNDSASLMIAKLMKGNCKAKDIISPEIGEHIIAKLDDPKDKQQLFEAAACYADKLFQTQIVKEALSKQVKLNGIRNNEAAFTCTITEDGKETPIEFIVIFDKKLAKDRDNGAKVIGFVEKESQIDLLQSFKKQVQASANSELEALHRGRKKALEKTKNEKERKDIKSKYMDKQKKLLIAHARKVAAGKKENS